MKTFVRGATLFFVTSLMAVANEDCGQALNADLANTTVIKNNHQFQMDFEEAVRRLESNFDSQSADAGGDIALLPYGIFGGGKMSYDSVKQWIKDFRKEQKFHISSSDWNDIYIRSVPADAQLDHWLACIKLHAGQLALGFSLQLREQEDSFTVEAKWVPGLGVDSVTIDDVIVVGDAGVSGGSVLKRNIVLHGNAPISQNFQRTRDKNGAISNGSISVTVTIKNGDKLIGAETVHIPERSARCIPVQDRLIALWSGNGTPVDSIGGSSLNGTAPSSGGYADGQLGQGFKIDGLHPGVTILNSEPLDMRKAVSMSAWVKLTEAAGGAVVAKADGNEQNYGLWVYPGGSIHLAFFDTQGNHKYCFSRPAIIPGSFNHIVGVIDITTETVFRVYVDGQLIPCTLFLNGDKVDSYKGQVPMKTNDTNLTIGYWLNDHKAQPPLPSVIDEIAIYNKGLNAEEIKNIFRAGLLHACKAN